MDKVFSIFEIFWSIDSGSSPGWRLFQSTDIDTASSLFELGRVSNMESESGTGIGIRRFQSTEIGIVCRF
jgi:hypothetical protein